MTVREVAERHDLVVRRADVARDRPAEVVAGDRLQRCLQLDSVIVHLADVRELHAGKAGGRRDGLGDDLVDRVLVVVGEVE